MLFFFRLCGMAVFGFMFPRILVATGVPLDEWAQTIGQSIIGANPVISREIALTFFGMFLAVALITVELWWQPLGRLFKRSIKIPVQTEPKKEETTKPAPPALDEKQALGQVHEYLGKDADVVSLPFRTAGDVVTTSTTAIDLLRRSLVNPISPMTPFFVVAHFIMTKSGRISLGLKLNEILIGPTRITTEKETGTVTWFIGAQRMSLKWKSRNQSHQTDLLAERPVAPIQDIAFQGGTDSGMLTIDEAWIYTLPIKN